MSFINKVASLYQPDGRRGDWLLEPQRICHREFRILTSAIPPEANPVYEVAKRIGQMFLLSIAAVPAHLLGVVGICIKACSDMPQAAERLVVRRPFDRPVADGTHESQPMDPETAQILALPEDESSPISTMDKNVMIQMLRFLPIKDRLNFSRVSKEFRAIATSDILWQEQLEQYRIIGPHKKWVLEKVRNGLSPVVQDESLAVAPAFKQLGAYYDLAIRPAAQEFPELYDYLARLIRGGPVAFRDLPRLDLQAFESMQLPNGIAPERMTHPMMLGKDTLNRHFMALRLIDKSANDPSPFVLVFVLHQNATWHHNETPSFRANQINTNNTVHLNYLLNLIKGEAHTDLPAGFSPNVELAD